MATKRIYPENASAAERKRIDALSDLSAYAYGFSDEKPGLTFWIGPAILVMIGILMGITHHA